jgi:hypothetical protein
VGAMQPLQIFMHPLGICKISKVILLTNLLKNVRHNTASSVASVELPWLEITYFKKSIYMEGILWTIIEGITYLMYCFCGLDKGSFQVDP